MVTFEIRETPIGTSPLAHARYLHGGGKKGYVTVAHKTPDTPLDDWHPHSYAVEELDEVVPPYGGLTDVYISQNRFSQNLQPCGAFGAVHGPRLLQHPGPRPDAPAGGASPR